MLNTSILVGRIAKVEKNKITVNVPSKLKNLNGEYDSFLIKAQLIKELQESSKKIIKIGDIIGVKGYLQTNDEELVLVAEKITLLSTKKEEED